MSGHYFSICHYALIYYWSIINGRVCHTDLLQFAKQLCAQQNEQFSYHQLYFTAQLYCRKIRLWVQQFILVLFAGRFSTE